MNGEYLDLSSEPWPVSPPERRVLPARQFLGIRFACCGIYARIYINRAGTAYQGNCPRCWKRAEFLITADGHDSQFFTVY